jgi:hypothetical protein
MEEARQYGQQDFNLPHDVMTLPSQGKFYKNKKKSIKVGYLTAQDENILISNTGGDDLVRKLIKSKVYEPDFNVDDLLEGDMEAIMIFLRNTAFGPEYNFTLTDPKTAKNFQTSVRLDELNITEVTTEPGSDGLFELKLPKSSNLIKCRLLTIGDIKRLNDTMGQYPQGVVAPVVTNRLEMQIVSVDGNESREDIARFVLGLPISDSKFIRKSLNNCEPRLDLQRQVTAPSGEKVDVRVTFGAEFFRPFF